jgi:hypothetical protein
MGRFERSERGGGQVDPQEALRRAREAVQRERASRDEGPERPDDGENELEQVEDAMREHDTLEQNAREHRDRERGREG